MDMNMDRQLLQTERRQKQPKKLKTKLETFLVPLQRWAKSATTSLRKCYKY